MCGLGPETTSLMLLHCEQSVRVWLLSPFRFRLEVLAANQIGNMWSNLGTSDFGGDKWKMLGLFAIICWNLWKARNEWVFKQVWVEEAKVITDALKEFDEVYQAKMKVTSRLTSQIMANPTG